MKLLSTVKEEAEAGASPIMRKVFAVLFPFENAGWNAGRLSELKSKLHGRLLTVK